MSLEPEEKVAAKLFRDRAQADLVASFAGNPPDYVVPTFIAVYRHPCRCRDERSTALELQEIYTPSPRLTVETSTVGLHTAYFYDEWKPTDDTDLWQLPAGRFGFIYRQGRCRLCGCQARSRQGRLVDAWQRPPLQQRLHR